MRRCMLMGKPIPLHSGKKKPTIVNEVLFSDHKCLGLKARCNCRPDGHGNISVLG